MQVLKATPSMRIKTFTTWERAVLIPVELVGALKAALLVLTYLFPRWILSGGMEGFGQMP